MLFRLAILGFSVVLAGYFLPTVSARDTGTTGAYLKQARAFRDTGRRGDARRFYELALREADAIGQNNPNLPKVLLEVAEFYTAVDQTHRSERLYRRAISLTERSTGKGHEDVAVLYHKLGRLFFGEGRYNEADANFRKALKIYESKLQRDKSIQFLNKKDINLKIADVLDDRARTVRLTQGVEAAELLSARAGRIRANPRGDHY